MLPRADIAGTRPAATVEPPTPVTAGAHARQEIFSRLAQITLGKQLQAEVLSRFDDGSFLVRVADTRTRMNLPSGTRAGDALTMTLLAHAPRPTFLLESGPGSAPAQLSSAGRLIDRLLQQAQREGASAAIAGKTPLLSSPALLATPADAPRVAAALHDAIAHSGVFYESHAEEWLDGRRTTAALLREPQAQSTRQTQAPLLQKLSEQFAPGTQIPGLIEEPLLPSTPEPQGKPAQVLPAHPAPADAATMPAPRSAIPASLAQLAYQTAQLMDEATPLTGLTQLAPAANAAITDADLVARSAGTESMSTEAMQLVNLQLHALEQRQVMWQSELFPGQPMEWEISEDAQHGNAEQSEPCWQSTVRFELPSLGVVSAAIRLTGDQVQVSIRTATENTAAALRVHGNALADALETAGAPLAAFSVKQDEQA